MTGLNTVAGNGIDGDLLPCILNVFRRGNNSHLLPIRHMPGALSNVSFDGSPVQFRMDSPLLVYFDPLALDMLGDLLPADAPVDVAVLLEQANANQPAVACCTIPDFRTGLFELNPHDIRKFGDDEEEFEYGEQDASEHCDTTPEFPFAAVDSGTLIVADLTHLPRLVSLLTWEQYDRSLADDTVLRGIAERLGGPRFAVIASNSSVGMPFDGDGTYTIAAGSVRPIGS